MILDQFPPVPDDFAGPTLLEVRPGSRGGRARFWRPRGCGYTDRIEEAGVYLGARRVVGSETAYAVDALVVLDAMRREADAFAANIAAALETMATDAEAGSARSTQEKC
jgi:hypothetical protein